MKRIIATSILLTALAVSPVRAETATCKTTEYGGATCGESTTTEVVVKHDATKIETGANDSQIITILLSLGLVAMASTFLYKKLYNCYILG